MKVTLNQNALTELFQKSSASTPQIMPLTVTFSISDECHALVWRDIDGNSLLHIAARLNHHDLAQVVLHKESDSRRVNQALLETNRNHKTPSDLSTDTKLKEQLYRAREQDGY